MRVRKTKSVSVDDVQFYLSNQVDVHPKLYEVFLTEICEMENKHKLNMLPKTRLELYSYRIFNKIKQRLAS